MFVYVLRFPRIPLLVLAALAWAFLAVPWAARDPLLLAALTGTVVGAVTLLDLWGYALRTPNTPPEVAWAPRRSAWSLLLPVVLLLPPSLLYLGADPGTVGEPVLAATGTGLLYGLFLAGPLMCAVTSRARLHACALELAAHASSQDDLPMAVRILVGLFWPTDRFLERADEPSLAWFRQRRLTVLARREAALVVRALEEATTDDPRTLRALTEADVALALLHRKPDEIDVVGSLVISGRVLRRLGVRPGDPAARVCSTNPLHGPAAGLGRCGLSRNATRLRCAWCLNRSPELLLYRHGLLPRVKGETPGSSGPHRLRWWKVNYGSRGRVRAQELLRTP